MRTIPLYIIYIFLIYYFVERKIKNISWMKLRFVWVNKLFISSLISHLCNNVCYIKIHKFLWCASICVKSNKSWYTLHTCFAQNLCCSFSTLFNWCRCYIFILFISIETTCSLQCDKCCFLWFGRIYVSMSISFTTILNNLTAIWKDGFAPKIYAYKILVYYQSVLCWMYFIKLLYQTSRASCVCSILSSNLVHIIATLAPLKPYCQACTTFISANLEALQQGPSCSTICWWKILLNLTANTCKFVGFCKAMIKSQLDTRISNKNVTPHGRSTFRHSDSLTQCLAIILFFYNVIIEKFPNSLKLSAS